MITMLNNLEGDVAVDEQNIWANEFGLDHPVLSDDDFRLSRTYWPDDNRRPTAIYIGPGAEILQTDIHPDLFLDVYADQL